MKRTRLLVTATVLAAAALGQAGVAAADDAAADAHALPHPVAGRRRQRNPAAAATTPGNTAPVAVDDRTADVVAGGKVTVKVLANDTDDGLGRPDGETPHLEIATFDERHDQRRPGHPGRHPHDAHRDHPGHRRRHHPAVHLRPHRR